MKGLENKVALVTGGGKGIGRAVALALAAHGVRVVVMGRNERALGETVGEIAYGGGKARHLAGDVRDPAHVEAAVRRAVDVFGGLDFVVASAGRFERVELGGAPAAAEAIFETNLAGVYLTFGAALRRMTGPGRLLTTALREPDPGAGARGEVALRASNVAVVGLVQAMAREVAARGITCNAIVPARSPEELELEDDVAALALYLCSSAADAISGQAIAIGRGTGTPSRVPVESGVPVERPT